MQAKVGDYVLVNLVLGKRVLMRLVAASSDNKKFKGVLESDGDEEPPVEFKAREIVANLGNAPVSGSVYGVKVAPLRERMDHPFWGQINVYHTLDEDKRKTLRKVLHAVATTMKASRFPKLPIDTHIRTQTGSMMGCYKYRPKAETDLLTMTVDEDMSDLEYRLAHEAGHGIWFRCMTPKMKMAWVNMYHAAVEVSAYSDKDLAQLREDVKTAGDVRAFAKENPDELPILRAIFKHIKQTHSMDRSHFDLALMLGEDIDCYWPTSLELGEKQLLLTKYAQKSPEELWAEAVGLHFIGKKLPSKIEALRDKTMRALVK